MIFLFINQVLFQTYINYDLIMQIIIFFLCIFRRLVIHNNSKYS